MLDLAEFELLEWRHQEEKRLQLLRSDISGGPALMWGVYQKSCLFMPLSFQSSFIVAKVLAGAKRVIQRLIGQPYEITKRVKLSGSMIFINPLLITVAQTFLTDEQR